MAAAPELRLMLTAIRLKRLINETESLMRKNILYYLAAAICIAWLTTPAGTHARNRSLNLSIEGSADSCDDLKVRSSGEIAQAHESFSLQEGRSALSSN